MGSSYLLYHGCRTAIRVFLGIPLRVRSWGQHNVPASGALIMIANHQSFFDPPLIGTYTSRVLHYMARDSLFTNPLFRALISRVNAFPVKRGQADVAAFKKSLRLMKEGEALLVFPEGTRSETGRVREMQPGAVALARKGKAAIILAAIEGAAEVWPRNARVPRPGRIWIEYAPPMDQSEIAGMSDQEAARFLTGRLRELHNGLRKRAGRPPFDYADESEEGASESAEENEAGRAD